MSHYEEDAERPSIAAELTNAIKRTPVMLVLDTSASMQTNDRIGILNETMVEFVEAVKSTDELADALLLSVITFGGVAQIQQSWAPIDDVRVEPFVAQGNTPLGDAVNIALGEIDLLRQELQQAGTPYNVPWMFLMSDGEPTDYWEDAAELVQQRLMDRKLVSFAFGIPPSDDATLRRFLLPGFPVYSVKEQDIRQLIAKWLVGSLVKVAESSPGQAGGLQLTAPPAIAV
ncbi:VWA domain-containing protein [Paraburkholderia agricolaris]|uniref:VWA domain-containing protein n=1 Tax=Paraburkholderia agricolaris TaxID=2152888 RepID=A0ABW8ZXC8_9BURK